MKTVLAKSLVLLIGLVALAPAAEARGIDCGKATTRLDKIICADPQMREYDGRIAAAYAAALTAWNGAIAAYVRRDQAAWLSAFRAIGVDDNGGCTLDADPTVLRDCIREEMLHRTEDVESGSYVHSGVYLAADGRKLLLTPRRANGYALRVFKLPDRNVASLDEDRAALWDGPNAMVVKMGDANGAPLPKACTLRLVPTPLAITVTQTGACDGHSYAGSYRRDLTQTLADYQFELF
ncbi:hypothetical protein [Novosphingobium sp. JCM 18896]|uniref:hypothetical protein n=1 Tax=Novosphingobium sp. JCM 18896 TaxID=2989731 RepID=UPI00222264D3|nr:hypothetical protein [Novosphingobium sp. JCM 18896]MCW1429444.1 hypothetical protein [Novosphingobium sp. JCM 18896]